MDVNNRLQFSANALSAPITPEKRLQKVDRSKVDPDIREAAEGMEAMFLDFLMQQMRQTVPENAMGLDSPATKIYTSMMDSEMAQKAAKSGGIGLADPIIAYLDSQRYTQIRGQAVPAVNQPPTTASTGGTDEGHPARK